MYDRWLAAIDKATRSISEAGMRGATERATSFAIDRATERAVGRVASGDAWAVIAVACERDAWRATHIPTTNATNEELENA